MEIKNSNLSRNFDIKNFHVYIVLLVVSILAFFQVFFNLSPTKWDMINCFLPWKYHVGECLQNGNLPLWNPYVYLGSPINADPSSGAWYPFTWLIGYFKGYSVYLIGFELWLHVFIAGIGFFKLSKTLGLASLFALMAGVAYMLSGFFIGNAQHLPYIISATWLPFILYYYIVFAEKNQWAAVIKGSFALFLIITGGYPAFTFILFYLVFFYFIYFLIKKRGDSKAIKNFIIKNIVFVVLGVLASSVMIISIYQAFPFLTRMENFSLHNALFSPFSPQSFISFILPYATTVRIDLYFDSDLSMRNAYFGIILFILFLASFFKKKPTELTIILVFGLFSLLASVGNYLPVREFLFNHVPLMNLFRFPSVFRLFFILPAIVSALYFLQSFAHDPKKYKPYILGFLGVSIIGMIITLNYALNLNAFNIYDYLADNLFTSSTEADFWKHIAVQSIFQLLLLILFFFFLCFSSKRKMGYFMLFIICLDLVVATQLNAPSTVYSHEWSNNQSAKLIDHFPKGFPMIEDVPLIENDLQSNIGQQFWANTSVFSKRITSTGFNSFIFTSYENLQNSSPKFYNELRKNRVLSLSDKVCLVNDFIQDSSYTNKTLFFNIASYKELSNQKILGSIGDSIILQDFGAFYFKAHSRSKNSQLLTLFQKNYPGWTASINGELTKIYTSNNNFITILVPKGENDILFEFTNKPVKFGFWLSFITILFMILFLISTKKKNTQ